MTHPTDDELEAMAARLEIHSILEIRQRAAAMLRACKGRGADYLVEFDNGESISLSSFSGGAASEGVMGSITLMKEVKDGKTTFRKYKAVTDWQSGLQDDTPKDLTPEAVMPIQMFRRRPATAGFSLDRKFRKIGSLLERGRNANGEYEIYASGIVWCLDKDKREWIGLLCASLAEKGPEHD